MRRPTISVEAHLGNPGFNFGDAEAFAVFASVIKTAMRQGVDGVEWLSALFRGVAPQEAPT